ncbi:phage/plasmid primase, P4 family [Kitasatospora sp. NPDC051914]|uniref:phage/plasmid primase, P4 family n=1 Tax=Kitasatospora sp. NPDC051914 TaxID=3154945 RepID=UPI003414EBF1
MYKTPEGKPVFREVKTENKGFFVQTFMGGTWQPGLPKKYADLLYHADQLLTATEPVYWVEGPKDAESLRAAGYLATTNHGGASNFKDSSVAYFGPQIPLVIVVPDEDEAGYGMLAKKVAALKKAGIPYEVRGVPEGKDSTDALEFGYMPEEWPVLTPEDIEKRQSNPYLHRVLRALSMHNEEPKDLKPGQPTSCPAHDDEHPSFSCDEGDNKAIKMYCFANCDFADILKVLEIPQKDVDRLLNRQKKTVLGSSRLPKTDSHTHNAEIVIERLEGLVVYVRDQGEYYSFAANKGWSQDRSIVRQIIQKMGEEQLAAGLALCADAAEDDEKQKARGAQLIKSGHMCLSNPGQKNIMEVVSENPKMDIVERFHERFDRNPNILVCKNGVIELNETGHTFRKALRPDDWTTLGTDVDYIPDAFCPDLSGMLDKFWPKHIQEYLAKALGYTIFGANFERWFFSLLGNTTGGKTTLMGAIAAALGRYAGTYQQSLFRGNTMDRPRPDLISLMHLRFISSSEAGEDWSLPADRIKNITGAEPQQLRDMRQSAQNMITMEPMYAPWMATNFAPKITGLDEPTARRICAIPCNVSIDRKDEDPSIRTRLVSATRSKQATLAWLVKGWDDYCNNGLVRDQPEEIAECTSKFIKGASGQGEFIDECVIPGKKDDYIIPTALWAAYLTWTQVNSIRDGFKTQMECTRAVAAALGNQKINQQRKRVDGKQIGVILGYTLRIPGTKEQS